MLRKNEIVTLRIEDMSDEGLGIGHTDRTRDSESAIRMMALQFSSRTQ